MSGKIQQIIAGLDGRTSYVGICPECGGGSRKRKTLSLHLREGVWLWLCHRPKCNERGALAASGEVRSRKGPIFAPRVMEVELRFPQPYDAITRRVEEAVDCDVAAFALRHGLRCAVHQDGMTVWLLKDINGQHRGSQSRTRDKFISTYRAVDKPIYGAFKPDGRADADLCIVVEDPLSAAIAAEDGATGIALLTNTMQMEVAQELRAYRGGVGRAIYVIPDPDGPGMQGALKSVSRLRTAGFEKVMLYTPRNDWKNLTRDERASMVEDMQRTISENVWN